MGSVSKPSGSVLGVLPSIQSDHVHISVQMGVVVEAVVVLIVDGVSVDVYVTVTVVGDVPVDVGVDVPVVGGNSGCYCGWCFC